MRILITGGAGFIGTNLSAYLLAQGHTIFCLDNFYTGAKQNIKHLQLFLNFQVIHANIVDTQLTLPEVDQIYNLACPASPPQYQQNPLFTLRTNIYGVFNLLEAVKKQKKPCTILQASTSEIYGDPMQHPQTEQYWGNVNPIGVRSCYDEGKRVVETILMDYYRQENTKIKIVRIFNTYGPYMQVNDGRVISNFIVQALQNKPITIYGDGKQTRSFCYISDLLTGMVTMMNSDNKFTGPINLGNPIETSILEIAIFIKNTTNSKSEIIFKPLPKDDPTRRCPDITLAKEKLNWYPTVSLDIGIKNTIKYFDQIIGGK